VHAGSIPAVASIFLLLISVVAPDFGAGPWPDPSVFRDLPDKSRKAAIYPRILE